MSHTIDIQTLIQAIGNHLYDVCGDESKKIIAYSTIEADVISCSIFSIKEGEYHPTYLAGDSDLITVINALWAQSPNEFGALWSSLCYCIIDGNIHLDVSYEDASNDVDRLERRDIVIEKYFGTRHVNYGVL